MVDNLISALAATPGIGIAAPQIGVSKRVIIFGYESLKNYPKEPPVPFTALLNPEYSVIDTEDKIEVWEHCLSIPTMRGKTVRYNNIRYSGYQQDGTLITRNATGIHAVLIQHEIDHLEGRLFFERLSPAKKDVVRKQLLKERKTRDENEE